MPSLAFQGLATTLWDLFEFGGLNWHLILLLWYCLAGWNVGFEYVLIPYTTDLMNNDKSYALAPSIE